VLSLDAGWAAATGLRAQCHAALGDSEKALADFAAALAHDPDHAAEYYLARATLWLDSGQYQPCVADCTAALNLVPDHAGAFRTRGLAYRELRDLGAAEADVSEAVRLEPDSMLARLALATIRVDAKQYAAARADCNEVVRRVPNSAQAFILRGVSRQHLDDLDGAVADFTEAARLVTSPTPLRLRADAHAARGDYAAAVRDLLEALKRSPRDAASFNQLAWLLATAPDDAVRNGEQAKECATRACELTEWLTPEPLDTLAAANAECGHFEDAVRWEERAIALAPPDLVDEYAARLHLYRDQKPYRMT
jgi:serine/threonine-protein kinase